MARTPCGFGSLGAWPSHNSAGDRRVVARQFHIPFNVLNCLVQCGCVEVPRSPDSPPPSVVGGYPVGTTQLIQPLHNSSGGVEIILSRSAPRRLRRDALRQMLSGANRSHRRMWRKQRISSPTPGRRVAIRRQFRYGSRLNPLIGRVSSAVEQRFCKPLVGSSILSPGTNQIRHFYHFAARLPEGLTKPMHEKLHTAAGRAESSR